MKFTKDIENDINSLKNKRLEDLFKEDKNRVKKLSINLKSLYFDYSKNFIDTNLLDKLSLFLEKNNLREEIESLFTGKKVNTTEKRAALHTTLRDLENKEPKVSKVRKEILEELEKVKKLTGHVNNFYKHIVNIGIGGSFSGPKLLIDALGNKHNIDCIFLANADEFELNRVLDRIERERTIFFVSSKSFSTIETLSNVKLLWEKGFNKRNFFAITSNKEKAKEFGILNDNILTFPESIGGRFSICSVISSCFITSAGYEAFKEFLAGAESIDKHFRESNFKNNIPVIMALLDVIYRRYFNSQVKAIIPYSSKLSFLPEYLQQLVMESNGKSANRKGKKIEEITGSTILSGIGTNAQHTFFQLMHQGNQFISSDFILNKSNKNSELNKILFANALAQSDALMSGNNKKDDISKLITGNKPSNILITPEINPFNLGQIVAIYEHKVFVEAMIHDINPFDQWGVELGKTITKSIIKHINNNTTPDKHSSTSNILKMYYD